MAQNDRAVLVALHHATRGANWMKHGNWNTNADLSQWYGIKVNDQGRVVELDVHFSNFGGILKV